MNQTKPWGFFDPFHSSLWIAIFLEICIVATACWICEAPACSIFVDTDVVEGLVLGWWDSLYWSCTVLLQTPDKVPQKSAFFFYRFKSLLAKISVSFDNNAHFVSGSSDLGRQVGPYCTWLVHSHRDSLVHSEPGLFLNRRRGSPGAQ